MDSAVIRSSLLEARISRVGAELQSLDRADRGPVLWNAGAVWPRHAPVLFPIVGRLAGDRLLHKGRSYSMGQHGFARDRKFEWRVVETSKCSLELRDDEATRVIYPFPFMLTIDFETFGETLRVAFTLFNPGDDILPASLGFHPAFRWPLSPGAPKDRHRIVFARPESDPIVRLDGGLSRTQRLPSPVLGRTLALDEALFDDDAVIFSPIRSGSAIYGTDDESSIEMAWDDFPQFGVWSRRGGNFVCLEPWHGVSSPVGFDAEFVGKPGLMLLPPGAGRRCSVDIVVRNVPAPSASLE
jgi:galactose mutarotase-like enzyme